MYQIELTYIKELEYEYVFQKFDNVMQAIGTLMLWGMKNPILCVFSCLCFKAGFSQT